MSDLAGQLRSYVDRLAELAEEHTAAVRVASEGAEDETRARLVGGRRSPRRNGRALWIVPVATVAALVLVVVAVAVMDRWGDEASRLRTSDTTMTTSSANDERGDATNGMIPGQAVVEEGQIRTFDAEGTPTGTALDAPVAGDTHEVSPDLRGGWVVCTTAQTLIWHPAGRDPIVLAAEPDCNDETGYFAGSRVQVIDSAQGPTAIYEDSSNVYLDPALGPSTPEPDAGLHAVVLSSGDETSIDLEGFATPYLPLSWSVATGRLFVRIDDDNQPYRLFDLTTGDQLPAAPISIQAQDVALSPDGATVALLTTDIFDSPSVDVVVLDLATGAEIQRQRIDIPAQLARLSYNGGTVAVSNFEDPDSQVVVIDLATGARRTLDAYGVVL